MMIIAYVCIIQEAVLRQEGTIARLLADDKGTRFKIAFGMPTLAHEGNHQRHPMCSIIPHVLPSSSLKLSLTHDR
jgi:hypothetical protein